MTARITELLADAPGFGLCSSCKYLETGSAALCLACAQQSLRGLAPSDRRCRVCDLPYTTGESDCRNIICGWSDRWFDWNYAIAMRDGALERAIHRYKYEDKRGWATIFGRILAGFIEDNMEVFEDFDLITCAPTFTGEGGRVHDHTRAVLEAAASDTEWSWPFDLENPPAITKVSLTARFVEQPSWVARQQLAVGPYRQSLRVPDHERVAGRQVLVYDDVFTTGHVTNEIARALRRAGASRVCGVTLARQPWGRVAP